MNRTRIRTIPDRIFHKMWSDACKMEKKTFYQEWNQIKWTQKAINQYQIKQKQWLLLLETVYYLAHRTLKEILEEKGITKAQFSHIFCVPIRTVESWYDVPEKCTAYMRLAILRHFHLFTLGRYLYLESEYAERKEILSNKKVNLKNEFEMEEMYEDEEDEEDTDAWLERELAKIRGKDSKTYESISNARKARDILEYTSYLDQHR